MLKFNTQIFATSTIIVFLTFFAACSTAPDVDYIIPEAADVDPDAALAACEAQRYLTLSCVDLLAENSETKQEQQAAVVLANQELNDVEDCYTYVAVDAEADTETPTTDTASCEDVAVNLLAGFDVCLAIAEDEKYFECSDIEDAVNEAVALCDASSADVTVDFCSLINPTTDTTTD